MLSDDTIAKLVDELGHLLPSQRPLEAFVHHNTLHHFEDQPFHEGVENAAKIFGAQAYMAEHAFRTAYAEARILDDDLDAVLEDELGDETIDVAGQTLALKDVARSWMLTMPKDDRGAMLRWRLEETDELAEFPEGLNRRALERLSAAGPAHKIQTQLWKAVSSRPLRRPEAVLPARPRDAVQSSHDVDTDTIVNPVLIRWCGAFLDPGHAYWPMTEREQGFYLGMLSHLSQIGPVFRGWMSMLTGRAQLLRSAQTSPERCIAETIERMGWPEDRVHELLKRTLLSLPGWAGMFIQLAARPDLAPAPPPPTPLVDFVAIRLLLDETAARWVTGQRTGPLPAGALPAKTDDSQPWALFNAARLCGVRPDELSSAIEPLEALLKRFDRTRRQWYWQLAYERRYRIQILDGVLNHWDRIRDLEGPSAKVQVVTCIDDREESLRRHLEEISPTYETYGLAGFYGVTAYYRALGEPHQRPLCPAGIVPTHLLAEAPADEDQWKRVRSSRSRVGRLAEAVSIGSDTLFRGGLISLWGWSSIVPLVTRILAPRLHARLMAPREQPKTLLRLETQDATALDHGLQIGFTPDEMIAIVRRMLEDMGLTRGFAPLVFMLGHGSSSLNNPHEAAHDCGACGGGRGGPNARAFAQMANRPDVREALAAVGIEIPEETWFVGGYHNTCDDDITLYDLELVPDSLHPLLEQTRRDLDRARTLDAHERVRRFESAALDLTPEAALDHVENRAEDLAQPRPEYGHCTNALCLVGRRAWNRGLFLDRRVFLTSYDPGIDPDGHILERLLASVGPVGAGINLEYYFSFVDPDRYGSNTKLPHNITALLGVMDGHSSDLRTGLPWQMVEIHEPVRLLNVIEARPEQLLAILERQPGLAQLIANRWILVAAFDPETGEMWFFEKEGFVPYQRSTDALPSAPTSVDWYSGHREHLSPATIARGTARPEPEVAA